MGQRAQPPWVVRAPGDRQPREHRGLWKGAGHGGSKGSFRQLAHGLRKGGPGIFWELGMSGWIRGFMKSFNRGKKRVGEIRFCMLS